MWGLILIVNMICLLAIPFGLLAGMMDPRGDGTEGLWVALGGLVGVGLCTWYWIKFFWG